MKEVYTIIADSSKSLRPSNMADFLLLPVLLISITHFLHLGTINYKNTCMIDILKGQTI